MLERFTTSITHLMVEGGSRVISSFLTCPKNVVDIVIITVAPVLVGEDGVGVAVAVSSARKLISSRGALADVGFVLVVLQRKGEALPELVHETTGQFGKDSVMVCKVRHRERFS